MTRNAFAPSRREITVVIPTLRPIRSWIPWLGGYFVVALCAFSTVMLATCLS